MKKTIENQQKISKVLIGSLGQMQMQLLPVQNAVNQLKPVLQGLPEACREATRCIRNLSFPRITVSYPGNEDEIPMPENRELFLAKESEKQISDLKEEIISLRAELKTERLERIKAKEVNIRISKNRTGSNEKRTQRERNKCQCYELFDEMMEKAPKMKTSEIKKVIATKMHTTVKTIGEYLRERP